MSIVRNNLMTCPGYTPYCGDETCTRRWPRTSFDGEQFKCQCGWRSDFEAEFIQQYKARWVQTVAEIADVLVATGMG